MPEISVIVPVYKTEAFLERRIDSILGHMLGEKPVEKRLLTGATEYKQPLTLWSAAVLFGCGYGVKMASVISIREEKPSSGRSAGLAKISDVCTVSSSSWRLNCSTQ